MGEGERLEREASHLHAALVFAELDALRGSPRWWKAARARERAYRRWQRRAAVPGTRVDPGLPPILDATCWHCGRPFDTRNPRQGLCPACGRLADEDTRVTRIEGLGGVAPGR